MIASARSTVVFGGGRERLQIMGFAMRLYHLGLKVAVEGDMTTPPVGQGDLFIVTVGPGEISTALALLGVAKQAGSTILVLTAQPNGRAAEFADLVLTIPAQTMADDQGAAKYSVLPMGPSTKVHSSCCSKSWCSSCVTGCRSILRSCAATIQTSSKPGVIATPTPAKSISRF